MLNNYQCCIYEVFPSISDKQNLFYTDFKAMLHFDTSFYVLGMEILALV